MYYFDQGFFDILCLFAIGALFIAVSTLSIIDNSLFSISSLLMVHIGIFFAAVSEHSNVRPPEYSDLSWICQ